MTVNTKGCINTLRLYDMIDFNNMVFMFKVNNNLFPHHNSHLRVQNKIKYNGI